MQVRISTATRACVDTHRRPVIPRLHFCNQRQTFIRSRCSNLSVSLLPSLCAPVRQVADLVSGETTALIALESGRVIGTIDCAIQPDVADIAEEVKARSGAKAQAQGGRRRRDLSTTGLQVFLKNLFVLPEHRRRGIARKLVKGAEAFARKERAGVLCLQVDRKNSAARELYYSCGFEDVEPPGPVEGGLGGALLRALGMGKNFMAKEA